ncbi:hypothetical protein LG299_12415 [Microbacterium lacus]|uniref:hypothetical protein n=1 Tax=Microbacterium lacus TaxID=415217 RepID=UPI00384CF561
MPDDRPQPLYRRQIVTGVGLLDVGVGPLAHPLVDPREVHAALVAHTNAHPEIPIRLVAEQETVRYVQLRESHEPTEGGVDELFERHGWRALLLLWTPLAYNASQGSTIADRLVGWATFDRRWWAEHGLAPWSAAVHLSPEPADQGALEAWQDQQVAAGDHAVIWSHRVDPIDAGIDQLLRQVTTSVGLARAAIGLAAAGGEF